MRRFAFIMVFLAFAVAPALGQSTPRATPDPALVKALKLTVSRAVGAFNSVDLTGLRRQFSAKAPGLSDDGAFRRLFFGYYLGDLGRAKSLRLIPADSSFDPDRALLVYEGAFDFWPRVKVSANFTRDEGALKLMQLRFEKIEN